LSLFAHVDNIFNRHYDTFGVLGEPGEVFADQTDPRFLGPAAPRGGWVGASLQF
jgi:outer membrane receptor protein involved in Fe transport